MEIVQVSLTDIKPYKNNAKKHPQEQVDNVAESIRTLGWRQPIVLDKDGVIIIGHGRFLAAKKLGLETAPCHYAYDLTAEQTKKLRLLDNKLNESEWDFDLLKLDSKGLDFSEYSLDWGFGEEDEETVVEEDDVPEVNEKEPPITQVGDIWKLGNHRLMCGDSTDALNINILMQGKKADLVFTDPPYGMKKESEGVLNDNLNYDDLLKFNKEWIPHTFDALKDNGSWYCWGIDEPLMDIYHEILKPMIKANKITFCNLITWNKFHKQKPTAIKMMRSFCVYDEKCLFVMCGVQGVNTNKENYFEGWESVRSYLANEAKKAGIGAKEIKEICGVGMFSHWFTKSQWDLMTEEHYLKIQGYCKTNGIEAFKREYEEIKREYYESRAYFDNTHETYMTSVWDFETANCEERELTGGHATPKPIALCSRAIKSSSREGEIVLDVFGGSGSTLIACEQLGRKCFMMELDPKYCDVIVKRWETLTGKKAVKL